MKQLIIKTQEFILRPLHISDAESLANNMSNKNVSRLMSRIYFPYKKSDAKKFINEILKEKNKNQPEKIVFGIEINGKVCGAVGFSDIVLKHKARIGYWLGEDYWSRGIMSKAVKKMIIYGVKELKFKRIEALVFLKNKGSKKVLEKNGFKLEGISRKELKKNGRYYDAYRLAKIF